MEFELEDFLAGDYVVHFDNMDQQMEFVRSLYAKYPLIFLNEASLQRYVRSDYPYLVYLEDYGRLRCLTRYDARTEFDWCPMIEYSQTDLAGIKKSHQSIAAFLGG